MEFVRRIKSERSLGEVRAERATNRIVGESMTPYAVEPTRPWRQLAIRTGLWCAIGIGLVGGLVGLVRRPTEAVAPIVQSGDETVPATVANFAELAIETWMTATPDDQEQLAIYFSQVPDLGGLAMTERTVGRVRAVGGREMQDGYWRVTVAVEVTEPAEATSAAATDTSGEPTVPDDATEVSGEGDHGNNPRPAVWHLQVGILGNARGGLMAVDAPAMMPPVDAAVDMSIAVDGLAPPTENDPLTGAVEGFFRALLAGQGDVDRYLVRENRTEVAALDPAPFVQVELELIAVEEVDDETKRVRAEIRGTTAGGAEQLLHYELLMEPHDGQWLIRDAGGAPTLTEAEAPSADPAVADTQSGSSDTRSDPTDAVATTSEDTADVGHDHTATTAVGATSNPRA